MPERVQPSFGKPQPFEQRMKDALAQIAVGEGRPRPALEEPTRCPITDEDPQHFGERLVDVNFPDRVRCLRSEILSFPNAPADVNHLALDVDILDLQPGGFTDSQPGSGEDGEQHTMLAWCCLDDSLQLLLRKVPLFRPGRLPEI